MKIAGLYSFAGGREFIEKKYPWALGELETAIGEIDSSRCMTKESKEKTMIGKMLYSPVAMNEEFVRVLGGKGWEHSIKKYCDYPSQYYVNGYRSDAKPIKPFRDMDFRKELLGCEVQFGKYSFMVYNVCAKMTIFRNLGFIDSGVEIVPVKTLADEMSTGVSYFEQFLWDLEHRGKADIDVPVLIIGIDA
jgi:hypothetical protein